MNNFQKVTLLAVLGLIASNASFAQGSLRDRFRDQNQPKATVYPEGFEESLADYQQTWETILSNSDLYIIFERLPNERMTGALYSFMPNGTDLFAVFKSGDNIFGPVAHGGREFSWKGAFYECNNLETTKSGRYFEPLALTNSNQDGFANFRSHFGSSDNLDMSSLSPDTDFEVNFDNGECYFASEGLFGLPPDVRQCTLRKYDANDRQLYLWYERGFGASINRAYEDLIRGIQDVSGIQEKCLRPE